MWGARDLQLCTNKEALNEHQRAVEAFLFMLIADMAPIIVRVWCRRHLFYSSRVL